MHRARSVLATAVCLVCATIGGPAFAEDRYALVIGNAAYGDPPLVTPPNNATLIRDTLFDLGFDVTLEREVTAQALRDAARRFGSRLQRSPEAVAIFYYSGLAAQHQGTNYLVPVKTRLAHENELPLKAVELSEIIAQMQQGRPRGRLVIVDGSPRGAGVLPPSIRPGLAAMRAPPGFLLAFAAQPDRLANPPVERNSYFAAALSEALREPGLPAEVLFSRVRRLVAQRTGQKQQAWHQSALGRTLFIHAPPDDPELRDDSAQAETLFWNSVRSAQDAEALEAYLQRYPNGTYADQARRQLRAFVPAAVNVLGHGTRFRDCAACPELVVVEAGSFQMGANSGPDNERPSRHVTIADEFAVGRFEVSFGEWDACVADGGCRFRPPDRGWGRDRRPAIFVSWNDAQEYVGWLSRKTGERYRLPSEAEWEYFARAGSRSEYPWGDLAATGQANCFGCASPAASDSTAPVGSHAANAFGLFDVIGNVWEWTQDCYVDSYVGAPLNGRAQEGGECMYRVFRGGSWYDEPERVRVGFRNGGLPGLRSMYVGLRVVRELR